MKPPRYSADPAALLGNGSAESRRFAVDVVGVEHDERHEAHTHSLATLRGLAPNCRIAKVTTPFEQRHVETRFTFEITTTPAHWPKLSPM